MIEKIEESVAFLKQKGIPETALGIVLGTGLHGLADSIQPLISLPYDALPHFPKSTHEYQPAQLV
jgi:purine-nucleoside phosphorylase